MADGSTADFQTLFDHFPGAAVGAAGDLHVFHAPNSICSQKVRAVLAHHGLPHWSHLLDIFAGDTYAPDYVRARHAGCLAAGLSLAAQHLGTTSVASSGCDACVVPTVIDAAAGQVLVDSLRICLDLDARAGGGLMPEALRPAIMAELSIVDELPNYQNLAVRVVPDAAPRNAFALSKVRRCDDLLARHGDDAVLRAAYEAKRAKEQSAAEQLFNEPALAGARMAVREALAGLEERLASLDGPWLFGAEPTMADLFWGAELIRAEDVGQAGYWQNGRLPRVAAWYGRLCELPALRAAIIEFPGARLSPPPRG